nr:hypothetical protein CVCH_083 [Cavernulicola chilensis]
MKRFLDPSILDLYLIKELWMPFFFCLSLFSFLGLSLGGLFQFIRDAIAGLSLNVAWQICVFKIPFFISSSFPIANLFTGLIAYNRLVNNNEFLALRSCGISLHRWLRANFFFGILVSGLYLILNELIIPVSNYSVSNLYDKNLISNHRKSSISHTVYENYGNNEILSQFIYARSFDGNQLKELILLDFEAERLQSVLNAKSAVLNSSNNSWICYDGKIFIINNKDLYNPIIEFNAQQINGINFAKSISYAQYLPNWLNISSTKEYRKIFEISNNSKEIKKLNIRICQKYTAPINCLILNLIGAILGSFPKERESSKGLSRSLLIIFLYYIIGSFSESMGLFDILPAWLAAWAPSLIGTFAIGLTLHQVK